MKPNYPIEMPDDVEETANLPDLDCSMRRGPYRCSNLADKGIIVQGPDGCYVLVAICNMCLEEMASQ